MRYVMLIVLLALYGMSAWAHDEEAHDDDDANTVDMGHILVPDNPTYHEHVRAIIESNCLACHVDGQIAAYAPSQMRKMWSCPRIKLDSSYPTPSCRHGCRRRTIYR